MAADRSKQRYVTAVRAPNSGIAAIADGSWYVLDVGQYDGDQITKSTFDLVPAVDGIGGDVMVFAINPKPKPFIYRGGLKDMPSTEDLRPMSREAVEEFRAWQRFSRDAPKPRAREPEPVAGTGVLSWIAMANATTRRRVVLACAMLLVPLAAAPLALRGNAPGGKPSSTMGLDANHLEALRAGSVQVTMVDPKDPAFMITVRSHRDGMTEVVDRFRTEHYLRGNGHLPKPAVDWLTPEQQDEVGRVRREREKREHAGAR